MEKTMKRIDIYVKESEKCYSFNCIQLFATSCSVACQAPLSIELSRQEYWSGVPYIYIKLRSSQVALLGLVT